MMTHTTLHRAIEDAAYVLHAPRPGQAETAIRLGRHGVHVTVTVDITNTESLNEPRYRLLLEASNVLECTGVGAEDLDTVIQRNAGRVI